MELPLLAPNDHIGEGNNNKGNAGMSGKSRAEAVRDAAVTQSLRVESNTLRHSLLPPSVSLSSRSLRSDLCLN